MPIATLATPATHRKQSRPRTRASHTTDDEGFTVFTASTAVTSPIPVRLERVLDCPDVRYLSLVITPHELDAWNGGREAIYLDLPAEDLDTFIDALVAVRDTARKAGVLVLASA